MKYTVLFSASDEKLATVESLGPDSWEIQHERFDGVSVGIDSGKLEVVFNDGRRARYPVAWNPVNGSVIIATPLGSMQLKAVRGTGAETSQLKGGRGNVKSSMPGKVIRLLCAKGDTVEAEQPLLLMEAMKMENEIRSPRAGVIEEIAVHEGQAIETGALLVRLADDQSAK